MGWWNSREPQPPAAIEPRSYPSDTLQAHIPGTRCGGCHCGAVRFEVKSKAPKLSVWCHCRNCQRISGGPVMVRTPADRPAQCARPGGGRAAERVASRV